MKEYPMLLRTHMVQAIMADRKTMTRRLRGLDFINQLPDAWEPAGPFTINNKGKSVLSFQHKGSNDTVDCVCPYGQPGDVLWVRESWHTSYNAATDQWDYIYKANPGLYIDDDGPLKWKPSIHMPRKAARIFLRITDIRVERLQDITSKDAVSEGVQSRLPDNGIAQSQFQDLWMSINGPDNWYSNPWVWVISFKKLLPND